MAIIEIELEEHDGDPHDRRLLKRVLRNQEKIMAQLKELTDEAARTQAGLDQANTNLATLLAGTIGPADSDALLVAMQGLTTAATALNAAILAAMPATPPPTA